MLQSETITGHTVLYSTMSDWRTGAKVSIVPEKMLRDVSSFWVVWPFGRGSIKRPGCMVPLTLASAFSINAAASLNNSDLKVAQDAASVREPSSDFLIAADRARERMGESRWSNADPRARSDAIYFELKVLDDEKATPAKPVSDNNGS